MKRIAAAVLSLTIGLGVQADTITFSFAKNLQTTEISQTGLLEYFDPALGTLTGVSLTLLGEQKSTLNLTNHSEGAVQFGAGNSVLFDFSSQDFFSLNALLDSSNPLLESNVSTGMQTVSGGATLQVADLMDKEAIVLTTELNGFMAQFSEVGGGEFALSCSTRSGVAKSGGGIDQSVSQEAQAACGASITYTYRAAPGNNVPEPGSLALAGLALLGVAAARRRRVH